MFPKLIFRGANKRLNSSAEVKLVVLVVVIFIVQLNYFGNVEGRKSDKKKSEEKQKKPEICNAVDCSTPHQDFVCSTTTVPQPKVTMKLGAFKDCCTMRQCKDNKESHFIYIGIFSKTGGEDMKAEPGRAFNEISPLKKIGKNVTSCPLYIPFSMVCMIEYQKTLVFQKLLQGDEDVCPTAFCTERTNTDKITRTFRLLQGQIPAKPKDVKTEKGKSTAQQKCPNIKCADKPIILRNQTCKPASIEDHLDSQEVEALGEFAECCPKLWHCEPNLGYGLEYMTYEMTGDSFRYFSVVLFDVVKTKDSKNQPKHCSNVSCPSMTGEGSHACTFDITGAGKAFTDFGGPLLDCCPIWKCHDDAGRPKHGLLLMEGRPPSELESKDDCKSISCGKTPKIKGAHCTPQTVHEMGLKHIAKSVGNLRTCCPVWKCVYGDGTIYYQYVIKGQSFRYREIQSASEKVKDLVIVVAGNKRLSLLMPGHEIEESDEYEEEDDETVAYDEDGYEYVYDEDEETIKHKGSNSKKTPEGRMVYYENEEESSGSSKSGSKKKGKKSKSSSSSSKARGGDVEIVEETQPEENKVKQDGRVLRKIVRKKKRKGNTESIFRGRGDNQEVVEEEEEDDEGGGNKRRKIVRKPQDRPTVKSSKSSSSRSGGSHEVIEEEESSRNGRRTIVRKKKKKDAMGRAVQGQDQHQNQDSNELVEEIEEEDKDKGGKKKVIVKKILKKNGKEVTTPKSTQSRNDEYEEYSVEYIEEEVEEGGGGRKITRRSKKKQDGSSRKSKNDGESIEVIEEEDKTGSSGKKKTYRKITKNPDPETTTSKSTSTKKPSGRGIQGRGMDNLESEEAEIEYTDEDGTKTKITKKSGKQEEREGSEEEYEEEEVDQNGNKRKVIKKRKKSGKVGQPDGRSLGAEDSDEEEEEDEVDENGNRRVIKRKRKKIREGGGSKPEGRGMGAEDSNEEVEEVDENGNKKKVIKKKKKSDSPPSVNEDDEDVVEEHIDKDGQKKIIKRKKKPEDGEGKDQPIGRSITNDDDDEEVEEEEYVDEDGNKKVRKIKRKKPIPVPETSTSLPTPSKQSGRGAHDHDEENDSDDDHDHDSGDTRSRRRKKNKRKKKKMKSEGFSSSEGDYFEKTFNIGAGKGKCDNDDHCPQLRHLKGKCHAENNMRDSIVKYFPKNEACCHLTHCQQKVRERGVTVRRHRTYYVKYAGQIPKSAVKVEKEKGKDASGVCTKIKCKADPKRDSRCSYATAKASFPNINNFFDCCKPVKCQKETGMFAIEIYIIATSFAYYELSHHNVTVEIRGKMQQNRDDDDDDDDDETEEEDEVTEKSEVSGRAVDVAKTDWTTKAPEVSGTNAPEVTSTKALEVTSTNAPEVTTTNVPEVTTTSAPEEVTSTDAPEVTTTSAPERLTTTQTPEVKNESLPEEDHDMSSLTDLIEKEIKSASENENQHRDVTPTDELHPIELNSGSCAANDSCPELDLGKVCHRTRYEEALDLYFPRNETCCQLTHCQDEDKGGFHRSHYVKLAGKIPTQQEEIQKEKGDSSEPNPRSKGQCPRVQCGNFTSPAETFCSLEFGRDLISSEQMKPFLECCPTLECKRADGSYSIEIKIISTSFAYYELSFYHIQNWITFIEEKKESSNDEQATKSIISTFEVGTGTCDSTCPKMKKVPDCVREIKRASIRKYFPENEDCCPILHCTPKGKDVHETHYMKFIGQIPTELEAIKKEKYSGRKVIGSSSLCPSIQCGNHSTRHEKGILCDTDPEGLYFYPEVKPFEECCPMLKCQMDDGSYYIESKIIATTFAYYERSFYNIKSWSGDEADDENEEEEEEDNGNSTSTANNPTVQPIEEVYTVVRVGDGQCDPADVCPVLDLGGDCQPENPRVTTMKYFPRNESCCPVMHCYDGERGVHETHYAKFSRWIPMDQTQIQKEKGKENGRCLKIQCGNDPTWTEDSCKLVDLIEDLVIYPNIQPFLECCPRMKCVFDDGSYSLEMKITGVSFSYYEMSFYNIPHWSLVEGKTNATEEEDRKLKNDTNVSSIKNDNSGRHSSCKPNDICPELDMGATCHSIPPEMSSSFVPRKERCCDLHHCFDFDGSHTTYYVKYSGWIPTSEKEIKIERGNSSSENYCPNIKCGNSTAFTRDSESCQLVSSYSSYSLIQPFQECCEYVECKRKEGAYSLELRMTAPSFIYYEVSFYNLRKSWNDEFGKGSWGRTKTTKTGSSYYYSDSFSETSDTKWGHFPEPGAMPPSSPGKESQMRNDNPADSGGWHNAGGPWSPWPGQDWGGASGQPFGPWQQPQPQPWGAPPGFGNTMMGPQGASPGFGNNLMMGPQGAPPGFGNNMNRMMSSPQSGSSSSSWSHEKSNKKEANSAPAKSSDLLGMKKAKSSSKSQNLDLAGNRNANSAGVASSSPYYYNQNAMFPGSPDVAPRDRNVQPYMNQMFPSHSQMFQPNDHTNTNMPWAQPQQWQNSSNSKTEADPFSQHFASMQQSMMQHNNQMSAQNMNSDMMQMMAANMNGPEMETRKGKAKGKKGGRPKSAKKIIKERDQEY